MSIDLRKLEHFVAVADTLNFTRAAQRLHLSQQALSTSIRSLERELGGPLFERDRRQVVLTAAGETLLRDAPWLLRVAGSLADRVRTAGEGRRPALRVGHTPAVTSDEAFACLRPTREARPDSSIVVVQRFPRDLLDGLYGGGVDVGLSRAGIGAPVPDRLEQANLTDQRLRIAVDAGHPRAGAGAVDLADLRDERFVLWAEPGASAYSDLLVAACRRAGFSPHVVVNQVQGTPPVTAVAGTQDVAFVTASPGPVLSGAVVVLDLEPEIRAPIVATWISGTTHPIRDVLVAEAQRVV